MFEVLTDLLKSGDYWIFWVIISILFLINLPKIIDVYDSTRKRRVIHLQDAISDQNVSDRLKQHFKDEVEIEHFRIAHGFAVSKVLLDA
ncbi:hypothetical protein, partial [Pontibacterium sp.]|uniref:hypothetical protein n=1 Tax=Pontibacterium sp. TaxID=2036026 RepID=UPI00351736B6